MLSPHLLDGYGGSMFYGCLSVCAYVCAHAEAFPHQLKKLALLFVMSLSCHIFTTLNDVLCADMLFHTVL